MKKVIITGIMALTILAFVSMAFAAHHAVKIAKKDDPGSYLTDTEGMTLYWFKNDSPGKSACSGGCLTNWPIYYRENVAPPKELKASDFGTITREDGKMQTTYKGYPLYYWSGDKMAGDTTGNKVKGVWFVIDPMNFPPK